MSNNKKFGTFSGVFTPSILTILGVIMYLRFPTIIGQAGLINTIAIIVIAHIISITTSLSVASLSTDKTVKTGGTYFMISRSLGLPIGGTLGLALFVGLSFSVSLYLIGFAESFLAYFDLDSSINSIRIAGTIILVFVTTITFISTSLAIKSQYFIMAAIVLSLISIFFGHHEFAPREIHLQPMVDAAPFMILFGIFFPAVTGFEAGVSMSGDLKDPKKSLPLGAIAAVGVGLVVYIGLAFFYAFTVDADALMNDKDILFKISLVPVLVIIGIWGATLSSALGSILGAPRILQAIAMDKIVPQFFAKGTGKTKEPRNALILAFVIAEAGILIGQLDVIARIVSMFFITTYAFLNLASAIESWSSSDFRPAFKIPKFVSILGATSAFIVMILLDFAALAGAVVVLGILFFYLRRKELVLESGDAWSSFWTNLAKSALLKLSSEKTEQRNWRPNIILFSGGKQSRPYLVELGLALSGKLGALTDFELLLQSSQNKSSKAIEVAPEEGKQINFFKRKFACESIESGIKTVTSVYGFSGFEPNTIMMGWSRNVKNGDFLAHVLTDLKQKKLNAVFLDYDKNAQFGKKESIDIWWNGKGRNLSFALNLMRILLTSAEWRDAQLRILIINQDSQKTDRLYRNTKILLNEKRIEASVKIINDEVGSRSRELVIQNESKEADLIVIGISNSQKSYHKEYIDSINRLSELPSSMMILSPSDEFEEVNLVDSPLKEKALKREQLDFPDLVPIPHIENKVLKNRIEKLDEELMRISNVFSNSVLKDASLYELSLVSLLKDFVSQNLENLEEAIQENIGIQLSKSIHKQHQIFLNFSVQFFDDQSKESLLETKDILDQGIKSFLLKLDNYIHGAPETILIPVPGQKADKEKFVYIKYRDLLYFIGEGALQAKAIEQLIGFEENSLSLLAELKKVILEINDIYVRLISSGSYLPEQLSKDRIRLDAIFQELEQKQSSLLQSGNSQMLHEVRNQMVSFVEDLNSPDAKKRLRKKLRINIPQLQEQFESFPEDWFSKVNLINQAIDLDCHIFSEQKIILSILTKNNERIRNVVKDKVLKPFETIQSNIENLQSSSVVRFKEVSFSENIELKEIFSEAYLKIYEILEKLPAEIEISENPNEELSSIKVAPQKIARYFVDTHLYEPFYRELEELESICLQAIIAGKESNSLIKFRIENKENEEDTALHSYKSIKMFLEEMLKQIIASQNKISKSLSKMESQSEALVKNALAPLFSHAIIESHTEISSLIRGQKSKKIGLGLFKSTSLIRQKINSIITDLLYRSSDGIILAQKYLNKEENANSSIQQILDIADSQMPEESVLTQTPVFYRTLFNSSSLINEDFWVPMKQDTRALKESIQRHKKGFGGAILIKGQHGSGKTALSRYAIHRFFKKDRSFIISPPKGRSVSMQDWKNQMAKTFHLVDYTTNLKQILPRESVVLINDLELWWERTSTGTEVIQEICEIINQNSDQVLFIINSNTYSYKQIHQLIPMSDLFVAIIECKPFDARQLQQLIYERHKSSGLTFYFQEEAEDHLSQLKMAQLFNQYFRYSQGIPGVAMNAWLAHISKVEQQQIFIRKPELPNIDVLMKMEADWLIIIALFIQHKIMDAGKLGRVMMQSTEEASIVIRHMQYSGILVQKEKDMYTLNKYMEPFLVQVCLKKGII
jgi:amino acid transporter/GTPase SAR1 family protein